MPDWSLETWRNIAIIQAVLLILMFLFVRVLQADRNNEHKISERHRQEAFRWRDKWEEVVNYASTWEDRAHRAEKELLALADEEELEAGEEYVRKSLGLSPTEDPRSPHE